MDPSWPQTLKSCRTFAPRNTFHLRTAYYLDTQHHRRRQARGVRIECQGLPLQRIDLGLQLGDALTLPHMLRWRCKVCFGQLQTCHRIGSGQQWAGRSG